MAGFGDAAKKSWDACDVLGQRAERVRWTRGWRWRFEGADDISKQPYQVIDAQDCLG